jgi:protein phosphatase
MDWQIATQTHRGNVRKINEDALLVEKRYPLLAVADGMGGHEAGDVASRMLVERLAGLDLANHLQEAAAQLESSIVECNTLLIEYARQRLNGQTIGCTVVAMVVDEGRGACLWAGDSRLYRARNGSLHQLTRDHSYVADLVRAGQLSDEQAANHPSSNVITRAVGAAPELQLDCEMFDVAEGDTFLLCSDGLYNEVGTQELLAAMEASDIWQGADHLLQLCLSRAARDNVTFVVARPANLGAPDPDATLTFYPGSN